MGKFEISHSEIPQLKGVLELPEGQEPTDAHFWEAAKSVVRPYGLSQLSRDAKISAYKNGFFEGSNFNITDQEDDPETLQDETQAGLLTSIGEFLQDFGRKADPFISPYRKVLTLEDEPVAYEKVENVGQFREAGKILFGLLDNREMSIEGDPVADALKQTGMPFYTQNKAARGMVKAAAMDYATDNVESSVGQGFVRGAKTSQFIGSGAKYLTNKLLVDEDDDDDIIDYVDAAISFDKINYEYENADELAAFVLENPIESIKGLVGVESDSYNFDSQLQQDLRSGYQQPSEGLSFFFEMAGDPLNLAMAPTAKLLTAPQRAKLAGKIKQTLLDTEKLTSQQARLQAMSKKLPPDALVQGRIAKSFESLQEQLAAKQKILNKYGKDSLIARMAGKSSPETLGRVAAETLDKTTPGGAKAMGMAVDATSPASKAGLVRKAAMVAGKLNPEITGATIGGIIAGAPGAAIGAAMPATIKALRVLTSIPADSAIRYIITGARNAGEEITEVEARRRLNSLKYKIAGTLGIAGGAGFYLDQDAIGGAGVAGAIATLLGPNFLKAADTVARDARVIGTEFIYSQTKEPFFRRVALLPDADEGLQGALRDRNNLFTREAPRNMFARGLDAVGTGARTATKEVFPNDIPFRTTQQGQAIGKAKPVSKATKGVADFMDKTGFGRYAETASRFGKNVVAASSLPASIGFIASAGEPAGAVSGAIMAAPFTAIGTGAGMYQQYKSKGDLFQKMIGDEQYYRDHLNSNEKAEFDQMPASTRMMLAGYSLSHPDVVFTPSDRGAGSFNPSTMEITYNPKAPGTLIRGALAHEISHFVETHGLVPAVNRILFGDPLTGLDGIYAKYDENGKVTYSEEFYGGVDKDGKYVEGLRDIYLGRLREDISVRPEDVARYEADPTLIGREIFADHGVDYLLSGQREAVLNRGPLGKLMFATLDGMINVSFLRDFALKIQQPLNARGDILKTTDLFKGKLKRIPELDRLIEQYYKDVRGKRKSEIEGVEITDPATGRKTTQRGARPIDDDFDVVYTVEDQKNPIVQEILDTGGIYAKDPDGKIILDASGAPKGLTKGELQKIDRKAGDHAANVFERNGIEVETDIDGTRFVRDINNLPDEVIDQLAQGPWHPRQIDAMRQISRSLRQGDGERAGLLLGYFAASQGRKPKAVPFKVRPALPYGFELTKQGNILIRLHERNQLIKNLEFLKGHPDLPIELRGMYENLFGSDNKVWEAFHNYRNNTAAGIDGRTGLDPDPLIADKKLNFLNALHGAIDKAQVARNPVLDSIGYKRASSNNAREPFGAATKTFRLDRIFSATRSGQSSGFNLERIKQLMNPGGDELFIPLGEADVPLILELIQQNTGGFTMDMLGRFPKKGVVVAPEKNTEFVINQKELDLNELKGYLERNAQLFEREGAHIGGWRNPDTLDFMLDVSFPLSERDAYRHAIWGDQDAIFDIESLTEISTKDENNRPKLPADFGETVEQVLKQRPSDLGTAAERSFRESSPIRDESIEANRRKSEGLQGEARDSEATGRQEKDLDEDLLMPGITRDSVILSDGTVIETGKNPRKVYQGGGVYSTRETRPESHAEALFDWVKANKDNPLAKKIDFKDQEDYFERTEFDKMREAQQAGLLVRAKVAPGGKVIVQGDPKKLTKAQKRILENDSFEKQKLTQFENIYTGKTSTMFDPRGESGDYLMPLLQDVRALNRTKEKVTTKTEQEFFQVIYPKMLKKVGGQFKESTRNLRAAAKAAVQDVVPFLKENPMFKDFYNEDMKLTRERLDERFGGIDDDQFELFKLAIGLFSPQTQLTTNVAEAVFATDEYIKNGNLDRIRMGVSPKGRDVMIDSPFSISSPSASNKAKTMSVLNELIKREGSVLKASKMLQDTATLKELDEFKKGLGYAGGVGDRGQVRKIVMQATGQDKQIPRAFIFGPKVGAFTMNALGRYEYNTIDVWESRFIRSYFRGMFDQRTGLAGPVDEHAFMVRFTEMFQKEFEAMTGEQLETSALQATRWYYMINLAKELGYTGAKTDDTISGYTKTGIELLGSDSGSGGQGDSSSGGGVRSEAARQALAASEKTGSKTGIAETKKASDLGFLMPQGARTSTPRIRPPRQRSMNRFMAPPAAAKAAVAGETLERFRR
jgi:hypothetical protein